MNFSMLLSLSKHINLFVHICVVQNCHFILIKKYIGAFPSTITSLFFSESPHAKSKNKTAFMLNPHASLRHGPLLQKHVKCM